MRSVDPMRNFPELDALPDVEAKRLIVETQKRISRQPAMLLGLIASLAVPAFVILMPLNITAIFGGLIGGAIAGAFIGLCGWTYLALVIRPRMRAAFRQMGYA